MTTTEKQLQADLIDAEQAVKAAKAALAARRQEHADILARAVSARNAREHAAHAAAEAKAARQREQLQVDKLRSLTGQAKLREHNRLAVLIRDRKRELERHQKNGNTAAANVVTQQIEQAKKFLKLVS